MMYSAMYLGTKNAVNRVVKFSLSISNVPRIGNRSTKYRSIYAYSTNSGYSKQYITLPKTDLSYDLLL